MNFKELFRISFLIFFCVTVAFISDNAEAKTELRMVGFLPMSHQLTKTALIIKDEIEKNSKGEVEIKFYPAQQLYNHKSSVAVLQKGGVEMGMVQLGFWTGVVPSVSSLAFMTFYNNFDHFKAVMDGAPGDMFRKDFEEMANLKVLGWANYGKLEIASKKPIRTLKDFKGMRIRGTGADCALWLQGVGAGPVTMNSGEVYQALQRGTVDAAVSGPSSFDQRKWYEVTKYNTNSAIAPVWPYFMVVHKDTWNKLTPELQKIFIDAHKKAEEYNLSTAAEEDHLAEAKLLELGMVRNDIPSEELARWREKGMPKILKTYKKRVGEAKAQKILDAIEVLRKDF